MKNIELEDKKLSFEPCFVEVIHFGEDIILADVSDSNMNESKDDGAYQNIILNPDI